MPDTEAFVRKYEKEYIQYLKSQGFETPRPDEPTGWNENLTNALRKIMFNPEAMLHKEYPQLMERWPAHLHIDILPSHQKQGWGRHLIEQFCKVAKEQRATGVHLGMAATNKDAGKFYTRVGFSRFPRVLDQGVSGENGRDGNTIWLVRTL